MEKGSQLYRQEIEGTGFGNGLVGETIEIILRLQ